MLNALATLLVCQLIGEVAARGFDLPVPGPVLGLVLLFLGLTLRGGLPDELQATAQGLLRHLSLLFVPAGTGIVLHLARIRAEWLAIVTALVLSTLLTLAVTALVFRVAARLVGESDQEGAGR